MKNILLISFGDTPRNNALIYHFENFGAKVYHYNFFNFEERKEYYKLKEPISGLVLGGATPNRIPDNTTFKQNNLQSKRNLPHLMSENPSLYKEIMNLVEKYYNIPILGICYGCQILIKFYGGSLPEQLEKKSIGKEETHLLHSRLFKNMPRKVWVDYNHRFLTLTGAPNSRIIAYTKGSEGSKIVGYEYNNIHYGVQFHIINSDPVAYRLLDNFYKICLEEPNVQNNNKLIYGLTGILLFIYMISNRLKK